VETGWKCQHRPELFRQLLPKLRPHKKLGLACGWWNKAAQIQWLIIISQRCHKLGSRPEILAQPSGPSFMETKHAFLEVFPEIIPLKHQPQSPRRLRLDLRWWTRRRYLQWWLANTSGVAYIYSHVYVFIDTNSVYILYHIYIYTFIYICMYTHLYIYIYHIESKPVWIRNLPVYMYVYMCNCPYLGGLICVPIYVYIHIHRNIICEWYNWGCSDSPRGK
jgi:hypothetical protein